MTQTSTQAKWYEDSREAAHQAELAALRQRQTADLSPQGWKDHYNRRYAAERDARPVVPTGGHDHDPRFCADCSTRYGTAYYGTS